MGHGRASGLQNGGDAYLAAEVLGSAAMVSNACDAALKRAKIAALF